MDNSHDSNKPVAYLTEDGDRVVTAKTYNSAKKDGGAMWSTMRPFCVPLYTSQQPSKPLTDEQLLENDQIMSLNADLGWHMDTIRMFARAIEAAHGIKGEA